MPQDPQIPSTPQPPQPIEPARLTVVRTWIRDLIISLGISVFFIIFLYQPVKVEGTSMLPGLEDQERIFINKFVYRWEAITRGDEAFVVDSALCVDCKGFYETPQCATSCPIEGCIVALADPPNATVRPDTRCVGVAASREQDTRT